MSNILVIKSFILLIHTLSFISVYGILNRMFLLFFLIFFILKLMLWFSFHQLLVSYVAFISVNALILIFYQPWYNQSSDNNRNVSTSCISIIKNKHCKDIKELLVCIICITLHINPWLSLCWYQCDANLSMFCLFLSYI